MGRLQQQKSLLQIVVHLREGVSLLREQELLIAGQNESLERARSEVARLQEHLHEQVVQGPMTAIEAHEFLSPHLDGAPLDLLLAVVSTLDRARRSGPPRAG